MADDSEVSEVIPYGAATAINSLVHLVQLRWHDAEHDPIVDALTDDDLAALNACFGADWGGGRASWESDRPTAVVIRKLGEAEADRG